ncbi:MAG: Ornithine cyclodeaminase [Chloroflexi bacterium]|nr:Ornithine cyclodeaminase [Chloroflexota bacterium]
MLLLTDEELRQALPLPDVMRDAVDAVERAERAEGEGRAAVFERTLLQFRPAEGRARSLVVNPAIVPDLDTAALKLFTQNVVHGPVPRERRTHGVTALFDYQTMGLIAALEDGHLDVVRTGAPSGVAVRHLANPDAVDVAIIGSGELAPGQLAAVCAVRPVTRVRVYSPTQEHRDRFAAAMRAALEIEVTACASARDAVDGAQVVVTVTNAFRPVIERSWLAPGVTVISVASGEIDAALVEDAVVFTSSVDRTLNDSKREPFATLMREGRISPDRVCALSAVVAGRAAGRTNPDDIVLYVSTGRATWDVAVATLAYQRCRAAGMGRSWP